MTSLTDCFSGGTSTIKPEEELSHMLPKIIFDISQLLKVLAGGRLGWLLGVGVGGTAQFFPG